MTYPPPGWGYDQGGYPGNPPQPYGYPAPYGYPPPRPTNGMAIASLVCSVAGVLCCALISVIGVVLGVIALNQIKQTGEEGRGYALAGIIVGGVLTVVSVIALIVYLVFFATLADTSSSTY